MQNYHKMYNACLHEIAGIIYCIALYFLSVFFQMTIEMLICKRDCNWSVLCQPLSEAILFFVNKRPIRDKKVEKVRTVLINCHLNCCNFLD